MRKKLIIFLIVLFSNLFSQKALLFFVIPDENKVYIILASPPKEMVSFSVYRKDKNEKDFKLLTPEPISKIKEPYLIRDILGEEEYNWLIQALKAKDEWELQRRLSDPGIGGALSLVSLNVARVLGKLYIDTTVKTGKEYVYRVAFINYKEEEFLKVDEKVLVQKHKVSAKRIEKLSITVEKDNLKLEWEYPKWVGGKEDIIVGFNIYKRVEGEKEFEKILPFPYLRTSEKLFYLDKNVEEGKSYEYYLTPVDLIGAEGEKSEVVKAKLKDITPPLPPLKVDATPEEGKVVITWEPSLDEDVIGYNIYRSFSIHGKFEKINNKIIPKEKNKFVDTNVVTGRLYVYKVSAIDDANLEGEQSTACFATPQDTTPPPPISNLSVTIEKRMVKLTWKPSLTLDLDGYYVYRAEKKDELFKLVGPPIKKDFPYFIDSGFAKKGLYPGRTYYYYVSQVDIAFNESKKEMVEVKIPDDEPPIAPLSIYCKNNDDGTVEIIWQVSLSLDLAKYHIYRKEEGKEILKIGEVDREKNSFLDKNCERGKKYFYYVSAVDSVGNESEKKEFMIIPNDIFPPPAPQNFKGVIKEKVIEFTWDKVLIDDLLGYNIYRASLPTAPEEKLNKEILRENKFLLPVTKGEYYYWVKAVDTSNNLSEKSIIIKIKVE